MARNLNRFTDSLIFIYDNDNNFLAKTTVIKHDRAGMYIEVANGLKNVKPRSRLKLLIVQPDGVNELSGILNSVRQGICEIAIFGLRKRKVRNLSRHTLNASALVSDMVDSSGAEIFFVPHPVIIENLSTTGILIESQSVRFDIGSLLQIEFNIHGKNAIIFGEVVREETHDNDVFKYGCKLVFLD
jgi:hypothetical protein